jgi:hypothetical protein
VSRPTMHFGVSDASGIFMWPIFQKPYSSNGLGC